ncbi:MAG: TetR/AcrR family transcriptional regulator [Hyphomonadaceae bacterium]
MLRVYAATNRLLQDAPFDQIAISEIAKGARVSVGSIYQRFPSKDALLWALYERYLEEAVPRVLALAERPRGDLETRVDAIVALVLTLFRAHRGIVRSLLLKYRHDPSQIPDTYHARIALVARTLERFLRGGGSNPSKRQATDALNLIMAGCREQALFSAASPRTDEAYARFLSAAITGALRARDKP